MNSKFSFIILVLSISFCVYPKSDIKIVSSDRNTLVIEYTPVYTDTSKFTVNSQEYIKAELFLGGITDETNYGIPAIPVRALNVGVPSEFGNTIQILSTARKELNGKLIPVPRYENDSPVYELKDEYNSSKTGGELVSFGEYGLVRDLPVQTIFIRPVQFDASGNVIRLYTKIVFRINFSQQQQVTSGYNDKMALGSVLNGTAAKVWGKIKSAQAGLKKSTTVTNSVLATGTWYRFTAAKEGMYKITRDMLSKYGIDASTVDPRKIKIYNNSGMMLPENINVARPKDLEEVAIEVVGEEDGKFDEGDYILFYGRGIDFWDVDTSYNTVKRFFNYYSADNYFWITASGDADGKRIGDESGSSGTPAYTQTSTTAYADLDEDKINVAQTGRIFVGDDFSSTVRTRSYTSSLYGRLDSYPVSYKINYVNATKDGIDTLKIYDNSKLIVSRVISGYSNNYPSIVDHAYGYEYTLTGTNSDAIPDNQSILKFNFSPYSSSSIGYLGYFEITYEKQLLAQSDYLMFFSKSNTGLVEYQLSGFSNSNIKVYDVTEYNNLKLVSNYTMLSGGECRFRKNESSKYSKYIAIGNDTYLTPSEGTAVSNSNLHGNVSGAEYVIITHSNFNEAAQRLKNYRQNEAKVKLSSMVVDVNEIFNEFGGGTKDPGSIRDFLKYAYDNWQIRPEYVFFFGGGTYDYKDIEKAGNNFIPTWQSSSYLDHINSYPSDDFFTRVSGTDSKVDLASGRITHRTAAEANLFVDKIIKYETTDDQGTWRNLITLISDDGLTDSGNDYATHTSANEVLANNYIPGSFDIQKVYAAEYPIVNASAGRRKPECQEAIIKAMNDGTAIINYIGHGNPNVWAHEYIFERNVTIPRLKNDKWFYLIAGTCDFALFDTPGERSSAEDMLFLPSAGSIGTYTATRPVYSSSNHVLINAIYNNFFSITDTLNLRPSIGYVNFVVKQTLYDVNEQKYFVFGDPALRINLPQYSADIDTVNSKYVSTDTVQIKALGSTTISGHIVKTDGSTWTDFNGEGILTVYDSERQVALEQIGNYKVTLQGGIIFRGQVSVTNGYFTANFIVPKDISYENKNGKVIMYFYGSDMDGVGYTQNVIVGGTDTTVDNDGKGPEIEIYFDDMSYTDSYLVTPSSTLIATLSDATGLNTTGTGVGHKLEGVLNDNTSSPIDFTNFFSGDLDSGGKSGKISYRFNDLSEGEYKMTMKAWDVFNNYSTETVYFSVVTGEDMVLRDIYNYPNPFRSRTTFTFQQNLNQAIDVRIKIYTVAGRLIKEIEQKGMSEKYVKVDWDGRDQDGDEIANGTYLYKIIVKTTDGKYTNSALGKLAVIR